MYVYLVMYSVKQVRLFYYFHFLVQTSIYNFPIYFSLILCPCYGWEKAVDDIKILNHLSTKVMINVSALPPCREVEIKYADCLSQTYLPPNKERWQFGVCCWYAQNRQYYFNQYILRVFFLIIYYLSLVSVSLYICQLPSLFVACSIVFNIFTPTLILPV